ncbi:MAG: hypothetical protein AAB801_01010 [Patescibacteria group bacterium]
MLGNGGPEREGTPEGSTALRALKLLALVPSDDWREIPDYQETSGQKQFSVKGYQTALEISGIPFNFRVEILTNLSPDSMSVPAFLFMSPYRLRVTRDPKAIDPHADYTFDNASVEEGFSRGIYKRLDRAIRLPREREIVISETKLRDDFEIAVRETPLKVKLTPGQKRIMDQTGEALRRGDREALATLLEQGARELAEQTVADILEAERSALESEEAGKKRQRIAQLEREMGLKPGTGKIFFELMRMMSADDDAEFDEDPDA